MTEIGFSIGDYYYWPNRRLNFLLKELIQRIPQVNAVELHAFSSLKEIMTNADLLNKFNYRSFHLPKKGYLKWVKDLNHCQKIVKFNHLIIHPNIVTNWPALLKYDLPIAVENMDKDKKKFKTLNELKSLLKKYPQLKFCFDLNHLHSNGFDNTSAWLKEFKNQIAEIHHSTVGNQYKKIFPGKRIKHSLCFYSQNSFDNLKIKQYPIILEGIIPPNDWKIIKKEFDFVKKNLK